MTEDSKRSERGRESAWKDQAIWLRVLFALLFLLILALLAGPLVIILGVAQGVFTVVTGEDNRNLRDLGASLTEYIREALLFATWNRERKPFPFAEFPRVEPEEDTAGDDAPAVDAGEARAASAAASEVEPEPEPEPEPESDPVASGQSASGNSRADAAGGAPARAKKPARKSARAKPAAKKTATGETPHED